MGFLDTILYPFMWLISWVMFGIHKLFTLLGMSEGAGLAWVLAIIGLTVVVRIIILPLYNKQIKASREMQILQPELQKIQKKYKGKRDQASQQRMQEETMALYREHGSNPFASCLPMLIQMPVLFALFRVLYAFPDIDAGTRDSLGPINKAIAHDFLNSHFFGAPLAASFFEPHGAPVWTVRFVTLGLIIFMSLSLFYTTKQLTMKNMPEKSMDPNNQAFKMQKYMMYGMPLIYLITGFQFQVGVMVYWAAGNVWNIGQQTWFIRNNPTPGSLAYKKRQERLRAKRLRKGISEEEVDRLEKEEHERVTTPAKLGKTTKKGGETSATSENSDAPARGKDGLTDEERAALAKKRYERRQAERARSKKKQQSKKKGKN
ncbi:MAG: membrane protein insertase YidC [Actinomycetaceae bacterium]|nr:membrane protein insertase YidC [Actinomycetaceae bacterium]